MCELSEVYTTNFDKSCSQVGRGLILGGVNFW